MAQILYRWKRDVNQYTSNIQAVYGGSHYFTVKAIGGGVGWIDAKYVINGQTYWAPRKYVNCLPNH